MIETGARRREIDEVASELFHANGYAATSVRDIAKALDIQGASLYAHVASKEDLLWAIVERSATDFETAADRATADTATADAEERLAALVEAHVEVVTADPERSSVFVTEWRHLSEPSRVTISERRDALRDPFPRCDRRRHRGRQPSARPTRPSPPPSSSPPSTGSRPGSAPDGRLSPDRIADHYVELALRSLSEDHR